MSGKFKPDRTVQSMLLGYNIDDFLDENHIVKLIDEIVEKIGTTKIEDKYSDIGQNGYSPKAIIKILFYGYTIGVFSSRKIEGACKQDLGFMYLARLYKPDHNTISDFRKNNINELAEYFVEVLKYCNEIGMLKLGTIAIDGSKFRANAAVRKTKDIAGYKKWEEKLHTEIKELTEKADKIDEEENNRLKGSQTKDRIVKEIKNKQELVKKVEQAQKDLETIKKEYEKEKIKREPKQNLTDKDAKIQKENGGMKRSGYNCQIAVGEGQIILAAEAVTAQTDANELKPMIEKVEENTGCKVEEVKADSGYGNCENFKYLEEREIDGYVPDQNLRGIENGTNDEYDKTNFKYDKEKDIYICPKGETLEFQRINNHKNQENGRIYKCKSCNGCEVKEKCTKAANRTVTRMENEDCQDRMRKKLLTPEGKKKYYERMNMAESPFNRLKNCVKFKQFLLRGLEKVKGEFKLLSIGFNIMKIHKWKLEKG